MNTKINTMKIEIEKQDLETLLTNLKALRDCLEDAPIDFLGTGSNSESADKEEKEWSDKWMDNYNIAETMIDKKLNTKSNSKWTLETKSKYILDGKEITRTDITSIPPTNGDRIDIIGTSGKYYYGMTKKKWMANMSKEDYLLKDLKINSSDKEFKKALTKINWTPRIIHDSIEILIKIKKGEITLSHKF